ncbi:MAG: hypothetical protein KME45_30940 [Stenomitos rutilans HA7619-LM2]|jgi:hypothetical protein|nr:hypothetical protein [Stenomitos rutilans HA7619-LM2]
MSERNNPSNEASAVTRKLVSLDSEAEVADERLSLDGSDRSSKAPPDVQPSDSSQVVRKPVVIGDETDQTEDTDRGPKNTGVSTDPEK